MYQSLEQLIFVLQVYFSKKSRSTLKATYSEALKQFLHLFLFFSFFTVCPISMSLHLSRIAAGRQGPSVLAAHVHQIIVHRHSVTRNCNGGSRNDILECVAILFCNNNCLPLSVSAKIGIQSEYYFEN